MVALSLLAASLLAVALPLHAAPYSAIYAFGDSLSDVGNVYAATGGVTPAAPYAAGQFSNGPVWVQGFAKALGLPALTPSLLGGTNYAYGGAQSGATINHAATSIDLTGGNGQIAQYQAAHPVSDPNALYTLWIGGNDLRAIPGNATPEQVQAAISQAVGNVGNAIGALAAGGVKSLLVVTVPDLGRTPAAIAGGPSAQSSATAVAAAFNRLLRDGGGPLPSLGALSAQYGISIAVLDSSALIDQAVADPGRFGFTNVTDPCLRGRGSNAVCAPTLARQDQYLFWDDIHPTAAGHSVIAQAAVVAVPEPASMALLGISLAMLAVTKKGSLPRRLRRELVHQQHRRVGAGAHRLVRRALDVH